MADTPTPQTDATEPAATPTPNTNPIVATLTMQPNGKCAVVVDGKTVRSGVLAPVAGVELQQALLATAKVREFKLGF